MGKKKLKYSKKIVFGDGDSPSKPEKEINHKEENHSKKRKFVIRDKPKTVEYNSDDEDAADNDDYDSEEENSRARIVRNNPQSIHRIKERAKELLSVRVTLPVYKVKDTIVPQILSQKVCVLIGETGSGKSTQIPQFLMEHNKKSIAVTQPRRVAAINLATRVAEEYGCVIGNDVGYAVRFNNVSTRKTKLKYITDGMLLREMMLDPMLSKYSTIVIDEAHERTILTDLLIGFLKDLIINKRANDDDFRVIIMSATLDAEKFSKFFNDAPILYVEGRMYPVERYYTSQPVEDIVDSMVKAVVQINNSELQGDILCFLPGQDEIDKTNDLLNKLSPLLPREAPLLVSLPLYAALPSHLQMKIFQPVKHNQRKVILATNIAETSITVSGIKYVIDSGLRKVKVWRHQLGLSTLLTAPVSKASATQRAGRAGRESGGKCYRLYKETDYLKLNDATEPEILRSDIISPVLMLKKMNVHDILSWHWLESPGKDSLIAALQQLYALQALDNYGNITDLGNQIVVLPVQPHLAAVLITAFELDTLPAVIDIVSCLSVDNLVLTPSNEKRDEVNEKRRDACKWGSMYGDLLMLKELYDLYNNFTDISERKAWCKELGLSYKGFKNVARIKRQLIEYMSNLFSKDQLKISAINSNNNDDDDDDEGISFGDKNKVDPSLILKSFLKGFVTNAAIGMPDRSYRTVTTGDLISIHPSSMLFGQKKDAIIYIEYVFTMKGYARSVSAVELEWLQEIAPHLLGSGGKVSVNN